MVTIEEQITQLLGHNSLVSSGALLIVAQSIWSSVRSFISEVFVFLRDRFIYKLSYSTSASTNYVAALKFLKNNGFLDKVRNLEYSQLHPDLHITRDILNFKFYKGNIVFFNFHLRDLSQGTDKWDKLTNQSIMVTKEENLRITYFGFTRDLRDLIENDINSLSERSNINQETQILINKNSGDSDDDIVIPKRTLDSVFLPEGEIDYIVSDISKFLSNENLYISKGINYKRVYLLEGVPGSGKTSLVKALASHFSVRLRIMDTPTSLLYEGNVREFFKRETFALIEEVDTINSLNRGEDPPASKGLETQIESQKLRDLLTILDGVTTPHGMIVFLTTNHLSKLDKALIRPGRVDYILNFDKPDNFQIESACKYYLGGDWEKEYRRIVKSKPNSMSEVQERLMLRYLETKA